MSSTNNRNFDLFDVQTTQLIVHSLVDHIASILELGTLIPDGAETIERGDLDADVLHGLCADEVSIGQLEGILGPPVPVSRLPAHRWGSLVLQGTIRATHRYHSTTNLPLEYKRMHTLQHLESDTRAG